MVRNRNGYWMSPKFFMSAGDGGGAGDPGAAGGENPGGAAGNNAGDAGNDAGSGAGNGADGANNPGGENQGDNDQSEALKAEIARLKADMAKQKEALDKATHEAGNLRKDLRSRMTQEQLDAETKREAEEKAAQELEELRRKVARAESTKTVMGKLGLDEETAGSLADCLYGAADVENALLEIQKAWQQKEAALRKEFGKLTGPGAGADSNSPEAQAIKRAAELGKARNALNEQAQKALNAYMR